MNAMKPFCTLVTAHTGCENTPHNTIASMIRGIDSGADFIEIDIRSTADGHLVLMHDETIGIRGRGAVPVGALTLADLRVLEKAAGIEFPHPAMAVTGVEEALDLMKGSGIILNLDLKDDSAVAALIRAVRDRTMEDDVVLTGCGRERAILVKREFPEIRVMLNVENAPDGDDSYDTFIRATCTIARQAGCCGINMDFRRCRTELVEYARLRFLPVSVWTVDREQDMRRMIELRVHSITTYEPGRLTRLLSG